MSATNNNASVNTVTNAITANIENLQWFDGEKGVSILVTLDKRINKFEQNKTTMMWNETETYSFSIPLKAFVQVLCDALLDTDLENKDVNRIKRQLKGGVLNADVLAEFACTELALSQQKVPAGTPAKEWDGRPRLNEDGSPQVLRRDEWHTTITSYAWNEDALEMLLARSKRIRETL